MDWRRTSFLWCCCTEELAGQEVVVNGRVNRRRDLGGMIFVDLRGPASGWYRSFLTPIC